MGDQTAISWADATWNPVVGCSRVSPGCEHCYAERDAWRLAKNPSARVRRAYAGLTRKTARGVVWTGRVRTLPERLSQPLRWRRARRIFVNSMSDLFHPSIPRGFLTYVFAVMGLAERHTFVVLTKRSGEMRSILSDPDFWTEVGAICETYAEEVERRSQGANMGFDAWWQGIETCQAFRNVELVVSAEDQKRLDQRAWDLQRTPAAIRGISAEPLLGFLNLEGCWERRWRRPIGQLKIRRSLFGPDPGVQKPEDWRPGDVLPIVILGGETGAGARPTDFAWFRSIRDQVVAAGAHLHVKQAGSFPVDSEYAAGVSAPEDPRAIAARDALGYQPGCEPNLLLLRSRGGSDLAELPADLAIRDWPPASREEVR